MKDVMDRIGRLGLVPVVVIEDEKDALQTAKAMIDGGLPVMEITLRTDAGIPSIARIKKEYPQILVGAGTVLSVSKAKEAVEAGAEFIVAPGFNDELVKWCIDNDVAVTPGCVTPTEIEHALSFGLNILKFFPASIYGGIKGCKALYGPYRMVKFIPTGGVGLNNLPEFADKEFIHAIGGGWLCKTTDISKGSFDAIVSTVKESIDVLLGFCLDDIAEFGGDVVTNNLSRAAYYLEAKGCKAVSENQYTSSSGKTINIKLK